MSALVNQLHILCSLCIQVQVRYGSPKAVGELLDIVVRELERNNTTCFDQLIFSLVKTGQMQCARLLDERVTESYLQDMRNSKHGLLFHVLHIDSFILYNFFTTVRIAPSN